MTLNDLLQLRDEFGYIDISSLNKNAPKENAKITLDDTDIYWKTGVENSYSYFTELVISELGKQIGLPFATYHLAKCGEVVGVISNSVVTREDTKISYNHFLTEHLPTYLRRYYPTVSIMQLYDTLKRKVYQGHLEKENANELLREHVKLMLFDDVVLNPDRHAEGNLILLKDLQDNVHLKPIDSEMSLLSHFDTHQISQFIKSGKVHAIVKNEVRRTNGILTMTSHIRGENNSLLNLTETKYYFPTLFENGLKQVLSLNLNNAFTQVEHTQKTTLPTEYKNWLTLVFDARIREVKEQFYEVDFIQTNRPDLEVL
jgi:hypothetical protein